MVIYLETARQAKEGQMGRMSLLGALLQSESPKSVPRTMFLGRRPISYQSLILHPLASNDSFNRC